MLAAVDPVALQGALDRWVAGRRQARDAAAVADGQTGRVRRTPPESGPREVAAVGGKVLRGARTADGQVKLVAVYDQTEGIVLGQVAVEGGDEIAALPAVLETLTDLADVLVTADALHCQRSHACWLRARGAHYALTVKGNQKKLRDTLARQPWGAVPGLVGHEVAHGRRETRSIKVLATDGQPDLQTLFPHAVQIAKIVRRRKKKGKKSPSVQTVYIITSLDHRQATPEQLAGWIRGQWSIENGLHWVRDNTQSENRSQVRTGHAPQNLAAFRNTVINLFRLGGHDNIAEAHRVYADQPHRIAPILLAA